MNRDCQNDRIIFHCCYSVLIRTIRLFSLIVSIRIWICINIRGLLITIAQFKMSGNYTDENRFPLCSTHADHLLLDPAWLRI